MARRRNYKKDSGYSDLRKTLNLHFVDVKTVRKPDILALFIDFCASPPTDRNPSSQKAFSARYGVDEDTLTAWKNLHGFWDDVSARREPFRKYTTKIVCALAKRAMEGHAAEVELWHRIFEDYRG